MDTRGLFDRQDLFDTLTIRLGQSSDRRDVLRLLVKTVVAMVVLGAWPWRTVSAQELGSESQLVPGCKIPGQKCSGDNTCCSGKCPSRHRCTCIKKGRQPLVDTPLGQIPIRGLCCTNKLNKRTNECR